MSTLQIPGGELSKEREASAKALRQVTWGMEEKQQGGHVLGGEEVTEVTESQVTGASHLMIHSRNRIHILH